LPVVWLPEAENELMDAFMRYDAIRPELGQRFANAVIETVEAISEGPLRFAVVEKQRRRAGVRRFPYGLFFIIEEAHRGDRLLSWQAQSQALARALIEWASASQWIVAQAGQLDLWTKAASNVGPKTIYHPAPLRAAMGYELPVPSGDPASMIVVLARSEDRAVALCHARASTEAVTQEVARKLAQDDVFWSAAPQLSGDWPAHWKRGWVYDFETLRMMVRRPLGLYRNPWDAMQIQAPRNVLAETSIDM
jgi:hypothetical protein